uniref:Predicted gene, 65988 n=1 Tax=Mus musculus TaxID=10090 RepID=A0AAQ4VMQ9_MOUSE
MGLGAALTGELRDALGMTTLHGGTEPAPSFSTQRLLY